MNPSAFSPASSPPRRPEPQAAAEGAPLREVWARAYGHWADLRNWLIGNAAFRRRAAAFPLTRPIARRNARALFDLVAGFVYSQTLLACVQLDLFAMLGAQPATAAEVGSRTGLVEERARTLLDAAASLGLVERRDGGRYGLGSLGAALHGDAGITAMIAHHGLLYADLADPVALLRGEAGGHLAGLWPYATTEDASGLLAERVAAYSALMAASQPMVAAEVLAAYPIRRHRHLLDIGGGDGAFLAEVARAAPRLRLSLYDLPAVAERARARFAATGPRAEAFGGDIRVGPPPPQGADVVSLVRVIHDHDDPLAMTFLRAARAALSPGGTLLLAEPMAGAAGAAPVGDAYFGFYLLAMGSGRARAPARLRAMIAEAGFSRSREVRTRTPLVTSLIVATA